MPNRLKLLFLSDQEEILKISNIIKGDRE